MAKKIQIDVDVNSEQVNISSNRVLTLSEQLRELRKEIQRVGPGKEQDLLIGKFNDINDELSKTNLKSKEFLGALGTLPGPVGDFANSLDFAVNALRDFTSFSFSDIRSQLVGLSNDFVTIITNISNATGITRVYTILNNALAASFVGVGVSATAAAAAARAFAAALTATGVGALVVVLGLLVSKLIEWVTSTEDATIANEALNRTLKEQERLLEVNLAAIDGATRANLLRAKIAGKSEQELFEIQKKAGEERLKELRDADARTLIEIQKASKNELLTVEQKAEKSKELNERSLKLGTDILKQISDNEALLLEFQLQQVEKRRQRQQESNNRSVEDNKKYLEKIAQDNKSADELLVDLENQNSVLILDNERKRQDKELELQKDAEEEKVIQLKISKEKLISILDQIDMKYAAKQSDLLKKRNEEDQKAADEAARISADKLKQSLEDELRVLEVQQRALNESTDAYYQNALDIEKKAYELKLLAAKDNAKQIEAINLEHTQNLKNIDLASLEAKKQIEIQRYQIVASIGSSLQQLAGKNKALAIAGIVVEKAAAIGQIVANTQIANAKAVAVSPLTFGQPWVTVNTIAGILSGAATVSAAAKAISEINSSGGGSSSGSSAAPASPNMGRNYAQGGLLNGPRHSQGGMMIEAEGGEAVMTRGAVTMFAPMLSMMNQVGGGTSFGPQLNVRPDSPLVERPQLSQEPVIMKTYVVSNELTSEQEKLARLKDLSTL